MERRVIFISGHINLEREEFETHYIPTLNSLLNLAEATSVVVGNANGADKASLRFLLSKGYPPRNITVYFFSKQQNDPSLGDYVKLGLNVISGFDSYTQRDAEMTRVSTEDLLWVRSANETKRLIEAEGGTYRPNRVSGTEKNLIRRQQQQDSKQKKLLFSK